MLVVGKIAALGLLAAIVWFVWSLIRVAFSSKRSSAMSGLKRSTVAIVGCSAISWLVGYMNVFVVSEAANTEKTSIIAGQMGRCLKLPENPPETYNFTAVVVLKTGSVEFVSVNVGQTPSDWEMSAIELIADAITDCGPYSSVSGRVQFAVTPELLEQR